MGSKSTMGMDKIHCQEEYKEVLSSFIDFDEEMMMLTASNEPRKN